MTGRGAPYFMPGYAGSLSVKYMLRGTGRWTTAEGRYRVDARHFAIVNEGQWYSFELGAGEPLQTFCPFIAPGFFADVVTCMARSDAALLDDPTWRDRGLAFPGRLHRAGAGMVSVLRRMHDAVLGGRHYAGQLDDLFRELAEALVATHADGVDRVRRLPAAKASTRAELDKRLHQARDHMHDRLAHPLVLAEVAAQAGLSAHHFHRLFRQRFGTTPHRYLVQQRLERAADLLRSTTWPVVEVAAQVGFDSRTSFTSRFRRHFGAPPGRWRECPELPQSQE